MFPNHVVNISAIRPKRTTAEISKNVEIPVIYDTIKRTEKEIIAADVIVNPVLSVEKALFVAVSSLLFKILIAVNRSVSIEYPININMAPIDATPRGIPNSPIAPNATIISFPAPKTTAIEGIGFLNIKNTAIATKIKDIITICFIF